MTDSTDGRRQKWATDDTRFFAVQRAGLFRLKSDGLSVFVIAGTYGHLLDGEGWRKGKPYGGGPGSLIDARLQVEVILEELGISEATWKNWLMTWQRLRMAHRCRQGVACLFTSPRDGTFARCASAACEQTLPSTSTARTEIMRERARKSWRTRTKSVRTANVPTGINGKEIGVSRLAPVPAVPSVPDEPSPDAVQRGRAGFDIEAWEEDD